MDVLAALADNLGSSILHLPLIEGEFASQAIDKINLMYLPTSPLSHTDYKETQAYVGDDGKIKLELISVADDKLLMVFVNFMSGSSAVTIANPFATRVVKPLLFDPLTIDVKEELDFLSALPVGIPVPVFNAIRDINYELATLLNTYNYQGRWMAGTFGLLSTAGFEVVYRGPSAEAPSDFLLDESPYVVILQLHQGETQGYVCLRT